MKDLHCGLQEPQKAMLLSGFVLGCLLQLATARQHSFSVIGEPSTPKWGQNITLSLRGAPSRFARCQWVRDSQKGGNSGTILTFSPENNPSLVQGKAFSGREKVQRDCSLHIRKLKMSDVGNYSVTINTGSTQQQGDTQVQEEIYQGSFYLRMPEPTKIFITVKTTPKYPSEGQSVTLAPQGLPQEFYFCEWLRHTRFGTEELIQTYIPGERQSQQQRRESVQQDCSLVITKLTTSDSGNYTIIAEAPLKQQHQPGKGTGQQDPEEYSQFYSGRVYFEVSHPSKKDPHSGPGSGSASLKYSAWIVAGSFLGSLAWTESLVALFSVFFCSSVDQRLTIH